MSKAMFNKSEIQKGMTPLYKVPRGSLIIPARPKMLMPNGGEINPSSTTLTIRTLYQSRSKFSAFITGKKIGMVRINIAKISNIIPQII